MKKETIKAKSVKEKIEVEKEKGKNKTTMKISGKQEPQESKMRQLLIETDGVNINVVKAEVSNLEMQAIFNNLLRKITSN